MTFSALGGVEETDDEKVIVASGLGNYARVVIIDDLTLRRSRLTKSPAGQPGDSGSLQATGS